MSRLQNSAVRLVCLRWEGLFFIENSLYIWSCFSSSQCLPDSFTFLPIQLYVLSFKTHKKWEIQPLLRPKPKIKTNKRPVRDKKKSQNKPEGNKKFIKIPLNSFCVGPYSLALSLAGRYLTADSFFVGRPAPCLLPFSVWDPVCLKSVQVLCWKVLKLHRLLRCGHEK